MDEDLRKIIDKVDARGGPASEQTLQELVAALDDTGKTSASNFRKAGDAAKRTAKTFLDFGEEQEEQKKKTASLTSIMKKASAGMSFMGRGTAGLTDALMTASYHLGEFSGFVAENLAKLSVLVGENVDVFRQLASVGATSTGNINLFRLTAAQAGLDIKDLGTITASLGPTLARFGGDAATGARRFATLIQGLTESDIRETFIKLGFTTQDIAEGAADYLDIQTQLGRSQNMTDQQLRAGAGEFLTQLDSLSRLTGQQRDVIKDQLRTLANEKRLKLIMNKEMENSLSTIEGIGDPQLRESFVNLFAKGFPESMEEVGIFAQDGMADAIRAVKEGQEGAADNLIEVLGRIGKDSNNASDAQKEVTSRLVAMGNGFFDIQAQSIPFSKLLDVNTGKLIEQGKAISESNEGMVKLDDASTRLKSAFLSLFTPIFEKFDQVAGILADVFDKLTGAIQKLQKEFPPFGTAIGIAAASLAALGTYKVGKAGIGAVKGMFAGGGGGKQNTFMGPLQKMGPGGGGMLAGMGGGLKALSGGMASFANPAVTLGAVNLGLSITAIGAGIAGATFLMGGALGKFADGLKAIGDVDGSNLLQVAKGTLALSGAMVAMAGGSGVSAVTGFFGKLFGGGTDNFAKNINNMLNDLDKNKIDVYAKSLSDLGEGMQSIRTGLSSSIGASGSATGDKLDQLNTTMEQILMVLGDGNRYAKITSGATSEIRDYT
tara:strand:- start:39 stop:2192 length:2154 start_codon:yes stop_codon:yes gene_type:complete